MSAQVAEKESLTWMHVTDPGEDDLQKLREYKFHPLDIQDCQPQSVQHPKMDIYRNYVFLVFHFPIYDARERKVEYLEIDAFVQHGLLVTVTKGRLDLLDRMFKSYRNLRSSKHTVRNSAGFQLYKIMDRLYRMSTPILNEIGESVNWSEEEVYKSTPKQIAYELAITRRNIQKLYRILDPQRSVMLRLINVKKSFLPEQISIYFDDVHDYLSRSITLLENFRDSVEGVHLTNDFLMSQRINNVMKSLTIISVSLLPLTLLTGLYGMNVEGLPLADNPFGLGLVGIGLLGVILGVIFILRKKEWL
ncbi:MAG: CorA family divalent cation transporter [bacterium]|nr:CorA family divalent cation transporter [bacterium]